ncbi:MAG: hypothetical protein HY258_09785, partial [Chloroflexi bacterium]|nr:hypothetical protein [Chloroflexota bacterium]
DVPVVFYAPTSDGTYTGNWQLVSPWGTPFAHFWVQIVVGSGTPANNKTATVYNVTAVTYDVTRTCTSANTFYQITAYISTNGPVSVVFTYLQSDNHYEKNNKLTFNDAGTKAFSWEWSQHIGSSTNPRWVQVIITSPTYQEYSKFTLPALCQ